MKNFWQFFLMIFCVLIFISTFTIYKNESLKCSMEEDSCIVDKVNIWNIKSTKKVIKYSDVKKVSYFRQKMKGNRFAVSYYEYFLIFEDSAGKKFVIFSQPYTDIKTTKSAIKKIRKKMSDNRAFFEQHRN